MHTTQLLWNQSYKVSDLSDLPYPHRLGGFPGDAGAKSLLARGLVGVAGQGGEIQVQSLEKERATYSSILG